MSLFSCVYPLTAMLLLVNNLTEIRSDAYKICNLFRKPFSAPVTGMGVWQVSGLKRKLKIQYRKDLDLDQLLYTSKQKKLLFLHDVDMMMSHAYPLL